jgi:cytochrome c-type biogenesis protein CcmF
MSSLGTFVLLAAFVVAAYAATVSVVGARRRSTRLVESGVGAFYATAALLTLASAIIVHAFVVDDFSIRYVMMNSDVRQPLFYKLTAYWGSLDGSILFWVALLSVSGAISVRVNREAYRELIPYVVAVISVVELFFLFLLTVHNNPFSTFLLDVPQDGRGMNPLLQTPLMVIHPPSLYTGFVGMTIPYAFGMAALITGHLDDSWLRAVRRWTLIGWLFLSFGLVLGMIWAYEELGWGGYWGWDPVENAGLLPWFTATAFLHSVMVQERRGMLRIWNVTLVILTFMLTIFATFMTRSGMVQSVHAFGEDPQLAMMFTVFMVAMAAFSFGFVIYRMPLLKARNELDSWLSREAAFLANNWILLFSAVFILFATMFPTLSEAVRGERLTVGPPFYNKWMLPIGLALLLLTGIGPLLAWRKSTIVNLRDQFMWPVLTSVVVTVTLVSLGVRVWASGICFALSAFTFGTISQEFIRGARVRQDATGTDIFTALIGLFARSRRRYAGYTVHLGIVLIFLGFAGEGFKKEEQLVLKPGQSMTLGGFTVRQDAIRVTDDGQKQMVTSHMTVLRDGKAIGEMQPGKWFYRKHEDQPTTEVAIRRGFAEDLYIVLAGFEVETQAATLHIVVNPLVNWIWLGFGVLAFGTAITLLPERTFNFATSKVPAAATSAASTTMLMIALLLMPLAQSHAHAQHTEDVTGANLAPKTDFERQMQDEIICMCRGCGRKRLGECACSRAVAMRAELAKLVEAGQSREEIYQYFMDAWGSQEPLASPIDKGFNRLAWAFPYALGGVGAFGALLLAVRWSKQSRPVLAGAGAPGGGPLNDIAAVDPRLQERLSDELRDLD